ncbi:MAG: protein kinase [Acidobacteria bacterium]|nr:protein kinase [Acidobacteriota bacterium]
MNSHRILEAGSKLGPYEIVSLLGSGGMGQVYLARDRRLDRDVAVKVLSPALLSRPDAIPRFEREARAASALNHPHILHIYDIGSESGTWYLAMELVDGETLRNKLTRIRDRAPLVEWLRQVAEALAKAHAAGIIHRDLKPDNVMISADGYAKVLDFGLAKLIERNVAAGTTGEDGATAIRSMKSEPGLVVGTVGYMAPEQAQGLEVDHRADIYSFGCILHEALEPLDRATDGELQSIVGRCLERDRERRYQSMRDVAADLSHALREPSSGRLLTPRAGGKSIAVIPFDDLSPSKDSDYLGEGVAEEIITDLSKIASLRVISRASAAQFRGTSEPAPSVATALGVEYLVTGSVRRAGERLRVTVQLLDAGNDVTLWAEKFDGTMDQIFDIQENVARGIAAELRLKLTPEESGKIRERPIENIRAYECYLRARKNMFNFSGETLDAAMSEIDRALELAGENALLFATKGIIHWQYFNAGVRPDPAQLGGAAELADRIEQLEPGSPRATALRGLVALSRGDPATASRLLSAALEKEPNDVDSLGILTALFVLTGRNHRARPLIARLRSLDPMGYLSRWMPMILANMEGKFDEALEGFRNLDERVPFETAYRIQLLMFARRFDEAAAVSEELLHRAPEDPFTRISAMWRFGAEGDRERFDEMFTDAVAATASHDMQYASWVAEAFGLLGDAERAVKWMDIAIGRGYAAYPYIAEHDWFFDRVRADPRFEAMLERMRMKWLELDAVK